MRVIADTRVSVNHAVRVDAHTVAQRDVIADDDVRADEAPAPDLGARADDCRSVNLSSGFVTRLTLNGWSAHWGVFFRSAMTLISSASAQSWPSTFASPRMR